MLFLLFLALACSVETGPRLPSVTGPRLIGVKSDDEYDPATKQYVPAVKVGVFALGTVELGGDAQWSDAVLSGACVAAAADDRGRVVVVREDKGAFVAQHLSPASGWSEPVALPWAAAALAGLQKECCPTERIVLTIAGDTASLLRPDGSATVFALASGASLRSYQSGLGGAHRFNRTHLVGTVFPAAEAARQLEREAKGARRRQPQQQRAAQDCAQPIDTRSLPESEAGKVWRVWFFLFAAFADSEQRWHFWSGRAAR